MAISVGVDMIEIDRVERLLEHYGDRFLNRVFTPGEIKYCRRRVRPGPSFAARFAAKEAVLKAFGDKLSSIHNWQDIEILNDKSGKPYVNFHRSAKKLKIKEKINKVVLSMSHCKDHAVATAILVRGK